MLRCVGRAEDDEFLALSCDKLGQVFAVKRRHVPETAMRAFIVTHAGPFIGPYLLAIFTSVDVQEPSHGEPLAFQTIAASRNEFDKSLVTQKLKLLANLRSDVLVAGVKIT